MNILVPLLVVTLVVYVQSEQLQDVMKRRSEHSNYASEYSQELEPYMFAAIPLHPPMPLLHVLSPTPLADAKRDLRHASSKPHPTYVRPAHASSDYTRTFYGSSDHSRPTYASPDYSMPSYNSPEYSRPSYSDYQGPSYLQTDYTKPSYMDSKYSRPVFAQFAPEPFYNSINSQLSSAEVDYSPQIFPSSMSHAAYVKPAYQTTIPHQSHSSSEETQPNILYAKPTAQGGYSYHKEPSRKRKSPKPTPPPEPEPPVIIRVHKYRVTRS